MLELELAEILGDGFSELDNAVIEPSTKKVGHLLMLHLNVIANQLITLIAILNNFSYFKVLHSVFP